MADEDDLSLLADSEPTDTATPTSEVILSKEFQTWTKSSTVPKLIYAKQCLLDNAFKINKLKLFQQSFDQFQTEKVLPYASLPETEVSENQLEIINQEAKLQYLKSKEKLLKLENDNLKIKDYIDLKVETTVLPHSLETAISYINEQCSGYEDACNQAYQAHYANRTTKNGCQLRGKFKLAKDFKNALDDLEITEILFVQSPKPPKNVSYKDLISVKKMKTADDFLSKSKPKISLKSKNSTKVKPTPQKMSRKRAQSPVKVKNTKIQRRSPQKRKSPVKHSHQKSSKKRR